MQYAEGIQAAQRSTVTALNFDLISSGDGEAVQSILRVATEDLKRAVQAIKAGQPQQNRLLDLVESALLEAQKYLAQKGVK